MSDFNQAIQVILKHEGGWVDNPKDPGGETNFGISMLIIRREGLKPEDLGLKNFDPGCMKLLSVDKAKELYKRLFWDKYGYEHIVDQKMATKIFDGAVNFGPGRAHKRAQLAVMSAGGMKITADGILGPMSISALNSVDPVRWMDEMVREVKAYYQAISVANPSLQVFLVGWMKRAEWR